MSEIVMELKDKFIWHTKGHGLPYWVSNEEGYEEIAFRTKEQAVKFIETGIDPLSIKEIKTDKNFWDCECKDNYIHPKTLKVCKKCKSKKNDQPDSREDEVIKLKNLLTLCIKEKYETTKRYKRS